MQKLAITLTVNDKEYDLLVAPNRTLSQVLREDMGLTGTKQGCQVGDCGSCTVLLDGQPVNSCLAEGNQLHPIQEAMVEHGAIQCGFCTPGMILSAKSLLEKNSSPSTGDIRQALSGNLCRCTGYQKIVEAIEDASQKMGRA
jgi:carbon-monoxide dehydrogenase small subunit